MSKVIGDYKVCIECANAFYRVAKHTNIDNNIFDFLSGMMYPFAVNASFACELYIKSIMIFNSSTDEFDKGHDLKLLFENLPLNDKNKIEEIYNKKSNKPLMDFLNEDGKTFVEWRYALEKPVKVCVSSLESFMESLREYVSCLEAAL